MANAIYELCWGGEIKAWMTTVCRPNYWNIEHSVYGTRKVSMQVPIELSTADQGSEQAKLQRWLQSS